MFLIRGKHKLIIISAVVVLCVIGSILYFKYGKKVNTGKPPVQLNTNTPTTVQQAVQPNQSKSVDQTVTITPPKLPVITPPTLQGQAGPKLSVGEYYKQAQNYQRSGRNLDAVNSYSSALKEDPHQCVFYHDKAQLEFRMTKKDDAISTLQEGLKYCPDDEIMQSLLTTYQAMR